ncbi:MAG: hypothetical protein AB7G47_04685 [Mycolicibacterium sp.]|uniref:hypothetical protein n=1 Tax=Mycolicibacterium sp. TaxID=2320850 RepID=UPI003D0FC16E
MTIQRLLAGFALSSLIISTCATEISAQAQPPDLGCRSTISAVNALRSNLILPPYFSTQNATKQGDEFDPNRYFAAFTHLKIRQGYTLDYVYHQDGMGGYPLLYARRIDQPPYANESAYRASGEHPDYLEFIEPQRDSQGFFEYATFAMTANQFYLDWHANYNDWRVVCGPEEVDDIIRSLEDEGSAGRPMTTQQQRDARAISNPQPTVVFDAETAKVTMIVFTKWGGFFRRTFTVGQSTPSILDERDEPLVEYDCGIAF